MPEREVMGIWLLMTEPSKLPDARVRRSSGMDHYEPLRCPNAFRPLEGAVAVSGQTEAIQRVTR